MRKKEEVTETEGKFADSLLMPILAVGSVFLFVILAFYAYDSVMKNKKNNEIVMLDGDTSEFKITPEDPGGMEVEHKDKEVFNTVIGESEPVETRTINIAQEEQPVSKEEISGNNAEEEQMEVPAQVGDKSVVVMNAEENPKLAEAVAGNKDKKIIEIAESKVQDSIKQVKAEEAPAQIEVSNATGTAKKEGKVEVKKVEEKKAPATEFKAEVTKVKDVNTGENKTVVMFKDMPKSMGGKTAKVTPVSEKTGSYFVQVSSHTSSSEAESAWKRVSGKYKTEVLGYRKNITEAEVSGKTFYRLSFGPFADRSDASTSCGILKAKGQDCIIQKY